MLKCVSCRKGYAAPYDEGDACPMCGHELKEDAGARVCKTCGGRCKVHKTCGKPMRFCQCAVEHWSELCTWIDCPACNGTGKEESDGKGD